MPYKKNNPGCSCCGGCDACAPFFTALNAKPYLTLDLGSPFLVDGVSPDCDQISGKYALRPYICGHNLEVDNPNCDNCIWMFSECLSGTAGDSLTCFGLFPDGLFMEVVNSVNMALVISTCCVDSTTYVFARLEIFIGFGTGPWITAVYQLSCDETVVADTAAVLGGTWTITLTKVSDSACSYIDGFFTSSPICTPTWPATLTISLVAADHTASQGFCDGGSGEPTGYVYQLRPCGVTDASEDVFICRTTGSVFDVGDIVLYKGRCFEVIFISNDPPCFDVDTNATLFAAGGPCETPGTTFCSPLCVSHASTLGPAVIVTISGTTAHIGTTGCTAPCGGYDGIYSIPATGQFINEGGACASTCCGTSQPIGPGTGACDCFIAFGVSGQITIAWCVTCSGGICTVTVSIDYLPLGSGVGSTVYQGTIADSQDCAAIAGTITLTRILAGACCDFPTTIDISFQLIPAVGFCAP